MILVLSDLWVPFPGGAERLMFNLARHLHRAGEDVRVLTGYRAHEQFDGPPIVDVLEVPENPLGAAVLQNAIGAETRVVPVPIATERFTVAEPCGDNGALRSLHVGGKAAAGDRNGMRVVTGALRYLVRGHEVFIRTQGDRIAHGPLGPNVTVHPTTVEANEYWEMYGDADMLVMPRRYAGLSLPVLEAMAAGLAIVMTNCEPQRSEWPISPLAAVAAGFVRTGAGPIPLAHVTPRVLAARMDWLTDHRDEVRSLQRASRTFAESQSWERLRPTIVAELERVCC